MIKREKINMLPENWIPEEDVDYDNPGARMTKAFRFHLKYYKDDPDYSPEAVGDKNYDLCIYAPRRNKK